MFEELIEYTDLEEACSEYFGFSGVTFKRDFGPWKQGTQVDTLWFNFETGVVESMDANGVSTDKTNFKVEVTV